MKFWSHPIDIYGDKANRRAAILKESEREGAGGLRAKQFMVSFKKLILACVVLFFFSTPTLKIESLPNELFQCKKLRTLNLGNNCLQSLPSRFGELTALTQLELRGNRLECLPVELGECRQLKRTGLVVEEDLFNTLPSEVKELLWKADKEQV